MSERVLERGNSFKVWFLSLISYLGVLCIVPLLVNKDDEYVNFHARQGLVLWIWGVLAIFSLYLPGIGKLFFSFSAIAILALSVIGMLSVLLNRAWKFPVVGNWAESL